MNKLFNLGAMLTIAAGAMMINSSCSSHDIEYNPAEIAQANYEKAFVTRFGQPAANQTWGFGEATKSGMTRTTVSDKNNWYKNGYDTPKDITKEEENKVLDAFKGVKQSNIAVDFSEFFVQQVHKGTNKYKKTIEENNVTGESETNKDWICSDEMDYLTSGKADATDAELKQDANHFYNFNNGNNTDGKNVSIGMKDENNCETTDYNYGISLMTDMSTGTFAYYCSTTNQVLRRYIILQIDGAYYVGFNFKAEKQETNTKVCHYERTDADDDYTDWIVKITPAKKNIRCNIRVIAEDLNVDEKSDFDFNDVVFDIKYGSPATIVLQAAGGTMPLRVGGEEVHEKFGVSTSTMVNTGNGVTKDPVVFTINQSCWSAYEANNIPVEVQKDGEWIEIKAIKGKAAAKIAVPTTYEWCSEREDIAEKYPKFNDYVTSSDWETIEWWVK